MIRALLWDVDGTLAETERDGHRVAFNLAFESMGLAWRWDVEHYGRLLRVTGGRERLLHDLGSRPDAPAAPAEREALAGELHRRKNAHYARIVAEGGIALRPGVGELLDEAAERGLAQAIVSTTARANLAALLRHEPGRRARHFRLQVCGEDVVAKKPDPEAYRLALAQLGIAPGQALAIEDSGPGAAAAAAAGVPVLVTRSVYFADDAIPQAIATGPGLHTREGWTPRPAGPAGGRVTLDDLFGWHALSRSVAIGG
jgi:HAD superfamily hydrolase (TIGR01509 family)